MHEESKGDRKKHNDESHKPTADNGSEDITDADEPENVDIESRQDNEQDHWMTVAEIKMH